jgi:hypothetical protein
MAEKVNAGLEKIFFHWILDHNEQFYKVEPYFFENDDIRFIYNVIREEHIINPNSKVPDQQQIFAMIKLSDSDNKISDNLIKQLLKGGNSSYEENWILPRFKSWKLSKTTQNGVLRSVDYIRGLDIIDYENVKDVAAKIRNIFDESKLIDDDDENLGEDFDDPENHKITISDKKISSGWSTIDKIMTGGWDQASLNILMGETNVGKCQIYFTKIKVKCTSTDIEEEICIGDFFEKIKNKNSFLTHQV